MIRMKAKNWLLSIALIMACFCFFACKDTKVDVETISFTEQSISMLVGEEYSPNIKILPSYATNRSYTLISGDTTALRVDGGTIVALKSVKDVKLKVVSNENENINDIITVDIYDEAVDLETPSHLTFDGNKFSFVAEDNGNASSYALKIGNREINIGNNTEYSFDNVVAKLGVENVYNKVLDCSVKSVGDGKVFNESTYSSDISFVMLSGVNDVYVESEILYFNGVENIGSYNVEIIVDGNVVDTKIVNNTSFESKQLMVNIADLTDSINGAEYDLRIIPDKTSYNSAENITIYSVPGVSVKYTVLGQVKNVGINDKIVSWDFVKNAESYTIKLYKGGMFLTEVQNIASNYIRLNANESGEYYCQVIANSIKPNTTTGKEYSNKLIFTILPTPVVSVDNNIVSWDSVYGAEGYLVTIRNNLGAILINNTFVTNNSFDVSSFVAGSYSIEVVACGNGSEILTSNSSARASWIILNELQLQLGSQKLYWTDNDASSLNKYRIVFNVSADETIDQLLTGADYNAQYRYDADNNRYEYDLSGYNFQPNTYTISVQSIGSGNVFDAEVNMISMIKLDDSNIISLQNKQFAINTVESAVRYEIMVYEATDVDLVNPIANLTDIVTGNKFILDDTSLNAGNYVAKIFTYGNNANIFDADNLNAGTTLHFEKLAIPIISVDSANLKISIHSVNNAVRYKLYENSVDRNVDGQEYCLDGLVAGEYEYKAKAVGNNQTILDSDQTIAEQSIKIRKLATPNIEFDKSTLTYTISCTDEEYVKDYLFTLNGEEIPVVNNMADCSNLINLVEGYTAEVYANPVLVSPDYNLIIASATSSHTVTKLDGECEFEIADGKLIVEPINALTGADYSLTLRIDNGEDDILLTDFVYTTSRFEIELYNEEYNAVSTDIEKLLQNPKDYTLYTTISQQRDNVVTSDEIEIDEKLIVLNRVNSIRKNSQNIEFGIVENATNYVAIIKLDEVEYYINIKDNYTENATSNVLPMTNLIKLMETAGVEYLEGVGYEISFVAESSDIHYMSNKGVVNYTFEFLAMPTVNIVEQDNSNIKYVQILNDNEKAGNYNITFTQGEAVKNAVWTKQAGDFTYISLDDRTEFVAGNIEIKVKSRASTGNYFESKENVTNVTKLDSTEIKIKDGILLWDEIENVKQYNLIYIKNGAENKVALYNGVENFVIENGQCKYDFATLSEGVVNLYLQLDSILNVGDQYYINSNNGSSFENVYKLSTPIIKVVNGNVYTEISNADLELTEKIALVVNGKDLEIDITKEQDNINIDASADKLAITINPLLLLNYGTKDLELEAIALRMHSNNETTLNSSIFVKEVYGLLCPTELDITNTITTTGDNVIKEIVEKISWANPRANGVYVTNYEIIINYNEVDYIFNTSETDFMMPMYYDKNSNGAFDESEIKFGAGIYIIKVRSLTDNNNNIVNSNYCESITVTVLETPTELATKDGNVVWSTNINVEYYLIRVYLLNGVNKTLLVSSRSNTSEFDLCNLNPFTEGVYGITVQAMHDNARILTSDESEMLQVVRLPQVASYYVDDGELYINVHSFYNKAIIYLTDKQTGQTTYEFTIDNNDLTKYDAYVSAMEDWATTNIIDTYSESYIDNVSGESYFVKAKYTGADNDGTLRSALAEGYAVQIKLFGNSTNKGAILSGHVSSPINLSLAEDANLTDKNSLIKLVTPTAEVSSTDRGRLILNVPRDVSYSALSYYKDSDKALKGVHLYEVTILTNERVTMYVAEIKDETMFNESLSAVGTSLMIDNEDKKCLKHFNYNGYTFNVIDSIGMGIEFNFNADFYYYYSINGVYSSIELIKGGSFVLSARFMGDDTHFIKSNISESATIKRYNVLNLTVDNGSISWLNQADNEDHPIYVVTLVDASNEYNVVLYNPVYFDDEQKAKILASFPEGYLFDTITYVVDGDVRDEYITYSGLADVIAKHTGETAGGTYIASVMTYYTDSTSNDKLLAQGAGRKTVAILPKSQISVQNGLLTWDLAYVTNTGGGEYIYNYLLEIFDSTNNKVYELTLTSGKYKISNNIATYNVPNLLENGADEGYMLVAGENYRFKLTALAGESTTYINSVNSETATIELLPHLTNIRMEEGLLKWENPTVNAVEIHVSYMIGDAEIVYITTENASNFELPARFTDVAGTDRSFVSGYDYKIKVRLRGTSSSLNGFYSEEIVVQRLATVNKDFDILSGEKGISAENGVLTWSASKVEGATYTVHYTLANGASGVTEKLATAQFDFIGFESGVISAQVKVHHDKYFSSFISDGVELFKLNVPTNIVFNEGTTTISWDKVVDHAGNEINDYMVIVKEGDGEPVEYKCSINEWIITGVTSNTFSIAVKAISKQMSGTLINSDYTEYQLMAQPHMVEKTTFIFDESLQAFIWKPIEDEQVEDKYYIGYNYYQVGDTENPVVSDPILVTETIIISGQKYYAYYPHVIGTYNLIYVQVVRAGSLSSQAVYYVTADGIVGGDVVFDLFESGDGVDNPYIIRTEKQLRNIPYFLNANYVLDANITLSSTAPITTSSQVFTGTINGNNHYIYQYSSAEYENAKNQIVVFGERVGLFGAVSGASFSNIYLSNFVLNGYLGSQNLYMGILVSRVTGFERADGTIKNSTFTNIVVSSSYISLIKNNINGYTTDTANIYIGVVAGYAENAEFDNCTINLGASKNMYLQILGRQSTKISVGGVAGFAKNCKFVNNISVTHGDNDELNDSVFIVEYILTAVESYIPSLYIGSIVGEINGENVVLRDNSCQYTEYTAQGVTHFMTEIGKNN